MDYNRFEKDNQRAFRKMATICKNQKFRLILQPDQRMWVSRCVDGEFLKSTFEKIHIFEDDFPFQALSYAMILPPDIPLVKKIIQTISSKDPKDKPQIVQFWFTPHLTDTVAAFLIDTDNAPISLLQTFPDETHNALKAGRKPNNLFEIYDLGIELLPLDKDCFTMNDRFSFLKGWVYRDLTIVSNIRSALESIISRVGTFASITSIGGLAKAIGLTLPPPNDTSNLHIILIDRGTDLITPCVTQMNYEGLIAEYLGINCGTVDVSAEGKPNTLQLLSTVHDKLFAYLAPMNHSEASQEINNRMNKVTGALHNKADQFSQAVDTFKAAAKVSIDNKTLVDHINLAENLFNKMNGNKWFKAGMNAEADAFEGQPTLHTLVSQMLEEGYDLRDEVRMLCLETLLLGGIPDFPKYIQSICFNHGIQQVPYLMRLVDCGMLDKPLQNIKWKNFVKAFKLYVPQWQEEPRDEAAAAYLGYAPLSIRYVQRIVSGDFAYVKKVIGDSFEAEQKGTTDPNGEYIVFFIGGCTHSELNTLRRLAPEDPEADEKTLSNQLRFKVVTTNMFSSREFFESIAYSIPGWKPE